jgi:sugar transferase (PEP-CTERM system associated)
MTHRFHWRASGATCLQLVAEVSWIVIAVMFTLPTRELHRPSFVGELAPALVFAVAMVALSGAFGLYRRDNRLDLSSYLGRLVLATAIGAPIAYLTAAHLPGGSLFQETLDSVVLVAFFGLVMVRLAVVAPLVNRTSPHRVLVLGTGPEARAVGASVAGARSEMQLMGFYPVSGAHGPVPDRRDRTLQQLVTDLRVDEIVVAVREQRGGVLPLDAMLDCRLSGVRVIDLPRFYESMHGRIPVDCLKASWLIYGNGFRQGIVRTIIKRTFDIAVATAFLLFTFPIIAVTAVLIALEGGGPIIYRQERVGLRGRTFDVLKFRSMRQDAEKDGQARWASEGDTRITRLGRVLRRARIDELPQLWNVLRGEMSFVGPRPERPVFVSMLTEQVPFYAVRLSVKPGLTGWAQVRYSYGATVEQSMHKLEYDLYYIKNHSLLLDVRILFETVRVVLLGRGAR